MNMNRTILCLAAHGLVHTVLTLYKLKTCSSFVQSLLLVYPANTTSWSSPQDTIPLPVFLCGPLEGFDTRTSSHWNVFRSSLKRLLWQDSPSYPPNTKRHDPTTVYAVSHSPRGGVPWVDFYSHSSVVISNTSTLFAGSCDLSFEPAHPPHMCSLLPTAIAACHSLGNGS